jgi:hypothetical protein
MGAYVLLVTWFAYGQPPSNYQTTFDSERACGLAKFAVLQEADRMADEVRTAVAAAAKRGEIVPASASPPKVSVVCTPKSN